MARRPRLVLPGTPLHIIQRGNNRDRCFVSETDYLVYLSILAARAQECACQIHAYVLMTNHVHLLMSPGNNCSASDLMRRLGQRYVQYFNRRHERTGTLWEGRFRSCLVADARYLLTCQRYIETNPVRAGMAAEPSRYRWSSYHANALGQPDPLVTPHIVYAGLGMHPGERQAAYRDLFRDTLQPEIVERIRTASNGNYALGDSEWTGAAARTLGVHVIARPAGRPKNAVRTVPQNVL